MERIDNSEPIPVNGRMTVIILMRIKKNHETKTVETPRRGVSINTNNTININTTIGVNETTEPVVCTKEKKEIKGIVLNCYRI